MEHRVNGNGRIGVGSTVVASRSTGVCDVGEAGVCYEVYTLDNRPGYSFIFERGRYDGFSLDEGRQRRNTTTGARPSGSSRGPTSTSRTS